MAAKRQERAEHGGSKRRVEYNLEKEPLQTGRTESSVDVHVKAAWGGEQRTSRRRMGGWLYVMLIATIVLIGSIVAYLMGDVLARFYYTPG